MAEFTIPDGFLSVQRCGRREQCTRDAKRIVELEARVAEYLTTIANQDRLVDAQEADIKKLEGRVAELDRLLRDCRLAWRSGERPEDYDYIDAALAKGEGNG